MSRSSYRDYEFPTQKILICLNRIRMLLPSILVESAIKRFTIMTRYIIIQKAFSGVLFRKRAGDEDDI